MYRYARTARDRRKIMTKISVTDSVTDADSINER